jgi:hypothetical protein
LAEFIDEVGRAVAKLLSGDGEQFPAVLAELALEGLDCGLESNDKYEEYSCNHNYVSKELKGLFELI